MYVRQKVSNVKMLCNIWKDWVWSSAKMADFCSAVQAINDPYCQDRKVGKFKRNWIYSFKIRFINRMLVSLDVPDHIVNTTSALYETVVAIDRENHRTQAIHGYQVQLHRTGTRGRPCFEITREQLSFCWTKASKCQKSALCWG